MKMAFCSCIKRFLKKLFCRHKNSEVVCWHWTHGLSTNEYSFIEIQLKCNDCGKYYFADIRDCIKYKNFISKHKDKEWSDTCKPVLF